MTKDVVWNSELDHRMRELHDIGTSFNDIATIMSAEFKLTLTRNSVIGRSRRLDFPMRNIPFKKKLSPRPRQPHKRHIVLKPRYQQVALEDPAEIAFTLEPAPSIVTQIGRLVMDQLTRHVCHWPHGAKPPYLYCGAPVHKESSFCREHYERAYDKPRKNWQT